MVQPLIETNGTVDESLMECNTVSGVNHLDCDTVLLGVGHLDSDTVLLGVIHLEYALCYWVPVTWNVTLTGCHSSGM